MEEVVKIGKHNITNQEILESEQAREPRSCLNDLVMTSLSGTPCHLNQSHEQEIDLNNPPSETDITPYNHNNPQNPTLNQEACHISQGIETLDNILKATLHPYWRPKFKASLASLPNSSTTVIAHSNITYPLITQLPDHYLSPETNEIDGSFYVVKNPPC